MPVLTADNLVKEFGGTTLFRGVTFSLDTGDAVGLVGRNGCGKTTLLRVLTQASDPDGGSLTRSRGVQMGYLPQTPPDLDERTLWEFQREVFADLIDMEATLNDLAEALADANPDDSIHEDYSALHHEFERLNGYSYESSIHKILSGLGFSVDQHQMPLKAFSGGWRTRAYLARLLLEEPDILLLDEPTNHLDVDTVGWLEQFLSGWKKSLIVVSHDRLFLNRVCNHIWDMVDGGLECYRGNYEQYQKQRVMRVNERLKRWESQQKYIDETQDFIRRNLAGQRTKEAQGRRKHLERFLKEEAIEKPRTSKRIHLRFADVERSGNQVLVSGKLTVGYGQNPVAVLPRIELLQGRRLGIIGPNGCGKSTVVKTWLNELSPLEGTFRYGSRVVPGYMSQTLAELTPDLTLIDCIREAQSRPDDAAARDTLGRILFSGDDVFKHVGDLSGGERSRLALARLALRGTNLLFLDEPTNHLDIESQEVLQQILSEFPGTLVFISHDRYLVQALATELLVFTDSGVHYYDGTLEEYQNNQQTSSKAAPSVAQAPGADAHKDRRRQDYADEKRLKNERSRQRKRFDAVEKEIHTLEKEKDTLEQAVGDAGLAMDLEKVKALTEDLGHTVAKLESLFEEWEELGVELDDI